MGILYKHTDYETGWIENGWIEVKSISTYAWINEFRCRVSNNLIEEESLFIERKNFKHRGNETDELHCYNRSSTPDKYKEIWEEWDCEKSLAIDRVKNTLVRFNIKINEIINLEKE